MGVKIPRLKLNIDGIANLAEMRGMYVVESEVRGMTYVYSDGEWLIYTGSNGYIRLKTEHVEKMIRELTAIAGDIRDLRR